MQSELRLIEFEDGLLGRVLRGARTCRLSWILRAAALASRRDAAEALNSDGVGSAPPCVDPTLDPEPAVYIYRISRLIFSDLAAIFNRNQPGSGAEDCRVSSTMHVVGWHSPVAAVRGIRRGNTGTGAVWPRRWQPGRLARRGILWCSGWTNHRGTRSSIRCFQYPGCLPSNA